jgi:L-serine dehydratase
VTIGVFDLFRVGIGPSSSHTVGPMKAARTFVEWLDSNGHLDDVAGVRIELFGSLGATGRGHGSVEAVVLGLLGEAPELVDPAEKGTLVQRVRDRGTLDLLGRHPVAFSVEDDVVLHRRARMPLHSNGLRFTAFNGSGSGGPGPDGPGETVAVREYYSIGGGFVLSADEMGDPSLAPAQKPVPYPFRTAAELLVHTEETRLSISEIMLANELVTRTEAEIRSGLLHLWTVMQECVTRGCEIGGVLPGSLKVRRRAEALKATLGEDPNEPQAMEWVTLYALAVNEENAAGGRVVTAPTNGAAGIVPAVLHYYTRFCPGADDDGVVRFLLTAAAIGVLFKEGASISGAEVGCQGEVGSACSMAAGALAEVLGGSPEQVENAAEIGIEHNLGLTCDPVGGLVQIPCIERNAVGSVQAITAARMALRGDGQHHVSLDTAIETMRQTGEDMKSKYKETSRGGLALNVIEC